MTQLSFATLDHRSKKKRTKREAFPAEMEAVVPWALLLALIEPYYPKAGKRDAQMSQSKKGNQWYFGMKAHIGVDARSGLVHTAGVTTGKVHDAKVMDNLIREDDRAVFADKGYVNEKKKRVARAAGVY